MICATKYISWPHGYIYANGDHLAQLGNCMDNTWARLGNYMNNPL